jgi:Leucine-rich repeat (LRR) protein
MPSLFLKLTHLNLSFNKLNLESLKKLVLLKGNLQVLDLGGNSISMLPDEFKYFKKLHTLNLSSNNLRNTKENILGISSYEHSSEIVT